MITTPVTFRRNVMHQVGTPTTTLTPGVFCYVGITYLGPFAPVASLCSRGPGPIIPAVSRALLPPVGFTKA